MNGRVYDPILTRFTSADPYIDGGYISQGFNRYSYVENNPMKYTDSSGYNVVNYDEFHQITYQNQYDSLMFEIKTL